MNLGLISNVMMNAIIAVLIISLPILLVALIIGLFISILQAVTSIQEQTLTFVPKILGILLTIALLGPWMTDYLMDYTINLFSMISKI